MMKEDVPAHSFGSTPPVEPEGGENGEVQATEEEQMNYDLLVVRAQKMMFGKGKENILQTLSTAERPSKGMGQVASMLVKSLMDSAKKSGREISGEVAMHAGTEIIADLNELAKAKGVFQYESEQEETQELQDALLWGVKYYGDGMLANGEITPEMQKMAQEQMKEGIMQEQSGGMRGARGMQKTPVAAGVDQAMKPPGGLVGGMMGGA